MDTLAERAAEHQQRVRLFVGVLLVVDLLAYISDFINPILFGIEGRAATATMNALRWGTTGVTVGLWLALRYLTLPLIASIAADVTLTLALATTYTAIALYYVMIPMIAPIFALLGIILLMILRAGLVPSTVLRTATVGALCLAILVLYDLEGFRDLDPTVIDGVIFMGVAIVIATAVLSHTIYGLRERVRDMSRLGQYVLESKLGEGGMGIVYRASHGMLRRPTAIKLLPQERSSAEDIQRFEREVQLTAKLTHPNTVTIFDYGRTPDGVFYYAMELLDGATLEDIVTLTGRQPEERTRRILNPERLRRGHSRSACDRTYPPRHQTGEHHAVATGRSSRRRKAVGLWLGEAAQRGFTRAHPSRADVRHAALHVAGVDPGSGIDRSEERSLRPWRGRLLPGDG